jgi:hypothetical protein
VPTAKEKAMKQDISARGTQTAKQFYLKPFSPAKRRGWTWQALGALFGFISGLITIAIGSLFTVIDWFAKSGTTDLFLRKFGTIFFLLAIPLFILGAHCLDLLERKR